MPLLEEEEVKLLSRARLFATPWTVACTKLLLHGIFQARVLEWVAISFCRESSRPRNDVVLSSRWQFEDGRSKGMGTEWDQEVVGKVDPQKRVLCLAQGFLRG